MYILVMSVMASYSNHSVALSMITVIFVQELT